MVTDNTQVQAPSSESREAGYETSTVSVEGLAIFSRLPDRPGRTHSCGSMAFDQGHGGERSRQGPVELRPDRRTVRRPLQSRPRVGGHRRTFALATTPSTSTDRGRSHRTFTAADLEHMYEREDAVFGRMGWKIDKESHAQLDIPQSVISQVIQDESARQGPNAAEKKGSGKP